MSRARVGGWLEAALFVARRRVAAARGESNGLGSDEAGFTLVELMVVLLIMSILMAIAIPIFLGAQASAEDRSSQSNLDNALLSARTIYVSQPNGQYPSNTVALLKDQEPELSFGSTSSGPNTIAAEWDSDSSGNTALVMAAKSDGACWYITDDLTSASDITNSFGDTFGSGGVYYGWATTHGNCTVDWSGVTNWDTKWPTK